MAKEFLTDEQVEQEIERLSASPLVALARREQRLKYRRRQYLYQLRDLEKKGRALQEAGITMELLNSVGHKDYLCDHTVWGAELCRRIGSPNFKLLYDIYHMQIMEGNVIEHIRKYHQYFSHIHTGGVPGRAEIDETQELYYPAIMKAIVETGYKGFVGQEFVPKQEDKIASLEKCIRICDV